MTDTEPDGSGHGRQAPVSQPQFLVHVLTHTHPSPRYTTRDTHTPLHSMRLTDHIYVNLRRPAPHAAVPAWLLFDGGDPRRPCVRHAVPWLYGEVRLLPFSFPIQH
jgi:hypothetical protein